MPDVLSQIALNECDKRCGPAPYGSINSSSLLPFYCSPSCCLYGFHLTVLTGPCPGLRTSLGTNSVRPSVLGVIGFQMTLGSHRDRPAVIWRGDKIHIKVTSQVCRAGVWQTAEIAFISKRKFCRGRLFWQLWKWVRDVQVLPMEAADYRCLNISPPVFKAVLLSTTTQRRCIFFFFFFLPGDKQSCEGDGASADGASFCTPTNALAHVWFSTPPSALGGWHWDRDVV